MKNIHIFQDLDSLCHGIADAVVSVANEAYQKRGIFSLALSGGSTPRTLYQILSTGSYITSIPWSHTHVFFGDERTVPPDHPDSNFNMANEALLKHVPIPDTHIHRMRGETVKPLLAAEDYSELLNRYSAKSEHGIPQLDLVLLGLGPDGHIASLFPDTEILEQKDKWVDAVYVNKLNTWRISLTFPVLNAAHHTFLLVSGDSKAEILTQVIDNQTSSSAYPVQRLNPQGQLEWYFDEAAAKNIKEKGTS